MRKFKLSVICTFVIAIGQLVGFLTPASAQTSAAPILTVSYQKTPNAAPVTRHYNLSELEALGTHTISTRSPWSETLDSFRGVLVRDLIDSIGTSGTAVKAVALNDYSTMIPISDFYDFDVILATEKDNQLLSVRERGPIWIIYPWSDTPELQNSLYYSRSVWQLYELEILAN